MAERGPNQRTLHRGVDKLSDSTKDLLNERKTTHGDFAKHAECTQSLKREIFRHGVEFTDMEREALECIALKIGRMIAGDPHFKDHWADIAGYAQLVADRLDP